MRNAILFRVGQKKRGLLRKRCLPQIRLVSEALDGAGAAEIGLPYHHVMVSAPELRYHRHPQLSKFAPKWLVYYFLSVFLRHSSFTVASFQDRTRAPQAHGCLHVAAYWSICAQKLCVVDLFPLSRQKRSNTGS